MADCLPCRWHRQVHYGDRHVALTGRDAYDILLRHVADHPRAELTPYSRRR